MPPKFSGRCETEGRRCVEAGVVRGEVGLAGRGIQCSDAAWSDARGVIPVSVIDRQRGSTSRVTLLTPTPLRVGEESGMHPNPPIVALLVALVAACKLAVAQVTPVEDPAAALRLDLAQCRLDREARERRVKQLEEQLRLAGDVEQLVRRMAAAEARVLELEAEKAAWREQVRQL